MAMARTDQRSFNEKCRPDAEHQQDDADFREFVGERLISDEARRIGAGGDACEQVADERGQAQPLGQRPEQKRQRQADDNGGYEWGMVLHPWPVSPVMRSDPSC